MQILNIEKTMNYLIRIDFLKMRFQMILMFSKLYISINLKSLLHGLKNKRTPNGLILMKQKTLIPNTGI